MNAKRSNTLQAEKETLRERVRVLRRGWDPSWVDVSSAVIQARLIDLPEFQSAKHVACYLARAGEVRTEAILKCCRRTGQRVYLPAFDAQNRRYGFLEWAEGAETSAGPLGIQQPVGQSPVDLAKIEFIVVPGMAFDAKGGRVGHGGGHYDRMLAQSAHAFRAAVCFDEQVVEQCPMGAGDMPMNVVVTPQRVLRVNES